MPQLQWTAAKLLFVVVHKPGFGPAISAATLPLVPKRSCAFVDSWPSSRRGMSAMQGASSIKTGSHPRTGDDRLRQPARFADAERRELSARR
jgi:hypothetical protein